MVRSGVTLFATVAAQDLFLQRDDAKYRSVDDLLRSDTWKGLKFPLHDPHDVGLHMQHAVHCAAMVQAHNEGNGLDGDDEAMRVHVAHCSSQTKAVAEMASAMNVVPLTEGQCEILVEPVLKYHWNKYASGDARDWFALEDDNFREVVTKSWTGGNKSFGLLTVDERAFIDSWEAPAAVRAAAMATGCMQFESIRAAGQNYDNQRQWGYKRRLQADDDEPTLRSVDEMMQSNTWRGLAFPLHDPHSVALHIQHALHCASMIQAMGGKDVAHSSAMSMEDQVHLAHCSHHASRVSEEVRSMSVVPLTEEQCNILVLPTLQHWITYATGAALEWFNQRDDNNRKLVMKSWTGGVKTYDLLTNDERTFAEAWESPVAYRLQALGAGCLQFDSIRVAAEAYDTARRVNSEYN